MLFHSLHFLAFFAVVVPLYHLSSRRFGWALLLVASAYFYAALIPRYLAVLGYLILVDYVAGLLIERSRGRWRMFWLATSLLSNLSVLYFFKLGTLVLPLGLSFHTFQAMSYTIDVYRGTQRAERHLGIFALFVLFFPQLTAGPIERAERLLPQLRAKPPYDYGRAVSGLRWMLLGFVKKVLIADALAPFVEKVYRYPGDATAAMAALAVIAFAWQIYFDFSGYSDIAVGSARVLGIELTANFARPYGARNLREFWARWHRTLTAWFRDYVYVPLGGSHGSRFRHARNVLIVFFLSGYWHGSQWTYLIWGMLHGVAYLATGAHRKAPAAPPPGAARAMVSTAATFAFVALALVFFRAPSVTVALEVLSGVTVRAGELPWHPQAWLALLREESLRFPAVLALLVFALESRLGEWCARLWHARADLRWATYVAATLALINLAPYSESTFLYFQF